MRIFLDRLYGAGALLAAVLIGGIFVVVVTQVACDLVNNATGWITGKRSGWQLPSYADFTGYFLCGASFLGLAYALRTGSHIRINLAIAHLGERPRLWIEAWCAGFGMVASGYFAYFAVRLVIKSYAFADVAIGSIATPLWIPQTAMAAGLVILTIALADSMVTALKGRLPPYAIESEGEESWSTRGDGT